MRPEPFPPAPSSPDVIPPEHPWHGSAGGEVARLRARLAQLEAQLAVERETIRQVAGALRSVERTMVEVTRALARVEQGAGR